MKIAANHHPLMILALIFVLLPIMEANSQNEKQATFEQKGNSSVPFKINFRFPASINNKYKCSEKTDVRRVFSDSSEFTYTRQTDIYFTERAPKDPEQGFQTIIVSIDSIVYDFSEDNARVRYNSVTDEIPPFDFTDIKNYLPAINKSFEMTYTPYSEVTDISGEQIEIFRDYVGNKGKGSIDSLQRFLWLEGVSDERLMHVADVKKIVLPGGPVLKDSVWLSPFSLCINGIVIRDTVEARFMGYKNQAYTINAIARGVSYDKKPAVLYNIEKLSAIDGLKGGGFITVIVNSHGMVERAYSEFNIESVSSVNKDIFKEFIHSEITWDLLGQYY